jgi:hypothetical protein
MSQTTGGQPSASDATFLSSTLQQTNQVLTAMLAAYNKGRISADYFHISTAGTFTARQSAGTLLSLNINQVGTGGTGTIYDAAGTMALAGSLTIAVLTFGTVAPQMLPFGPADRGLSVNNGVVIVTTGNADITLGTA